MDHPRIVWISGYGFEPVAADPDDLDPGTTETHLVRHPSLSRAPTTCPGTAPEPRPTTDAEFDQSQRHARGGTANNSIDDCDPQ